MARPNTKQPDTLLSILRPFAEPTAPPLVAPHSFHRFSTQSEEPWKKLQDLLAVTETISTTLTAQHNLSGQQLDPKTIALMKQSVTEREQLFSVSLHG